MANAAGASVSSTVCVTFPPDRFPGSLVDAVADFSHYGDLSRIDMTAGCGAGRLLVTYYDIRDAAKVLEAYKERAEELPPMAHDFRKVSINTRLFASLPPHFAGFQVFGDIAGVSISGEDVVVEFFDARAAQQVALCLPGCHPLTSQAETPAEETRDASMAMWAFTSRLAEAYQEQLNASRMMMMMNLKGPMDAAAHAAHTGAVPSGPPGLMEEMSKVGVSLSAALHKMPAAGGKAEGSAAKAAASAGAKGVAGTISGGGPGKPLREKVDSKDLSKFDIVPKMVRAGKDARTTVMVRNIPKSCSREAFVEALNKLSLSDRFTFFYMPFDKRRNIHCGFAFVNFKAPHDVLELFEGMKTADMHGTGHGAPPAVSYARLQGQEQLMKHFSLSAVMNDNDARKRPVFTDMPKGQTKGTEQKEYLEHDSPVAESSSRKYFQDAPMVIPMFASEFDGEHEAFLHSCGIGA